VVSKLKHEIKEMAAWHVQNNPMLRKLEKRGVSATDTLAAIMAVTISIENSANDIVRSERFPMKRFNVFGKKRTVNLNTLFGWKYPLPSHRFIGDAAFVFGLHPNPSTGLANIKLHEAAAVFQDEDTTLRFACAYDERSIMRDALLDQHPFVNGLFFKDKGQKRLLFGILQRQLFSLDFLAGKAANFTQQIAGLGRQPSVFNVSYGFMHHDIGSVADAIVERGFFEEDEEAYFNSPAFTNNGGVKRGRAVVNGLEEAARRLDIPVLLFQERFNPDEAGFFRSQELANGGW
jgi:hypothetical protein